MKKVRHFLPKINKSHWFAIGLGLICLLLMLSAGFYKIPFASSFLKNLDYRIYDQIIHLNWRQHNPTPRVVIIDINDASIQKEGRWPWRRDRIAELLNKLKKNGVVTVGLDIVMSEEEINYALGLRNKLKEIIPKPSESDRILFSTLNKLAPSVDSDKSLAKTLIDNHVVLGFLFHNDPDVKRGKLPMPLADAEGKPFRSDLFPAFQFKSYNGSVDVLVDAAQQSGFVSNIPDEDGAIRHALVMANYGGKLYPSMALATAMNYLLSNTVTLVTKEGKLTGIKLDGTFIPTNNQGQILVPFWGKPGTLNYYSATDILQDKVPAKDLQGSIAIIGSTLALLADLHESPVSLTFPGVEIVGNIVQSIVSQQLVVEFDWHSTYGILLILFIGVFFALLLPFININLALLTSLITVLVLLFGSVFLFVQYSLYVPTALLVSLISLEAIVNYAYSFLLERRQRKHISHLFGQYVPEDYLKELIQSPDHSSMEGQTRDMTVLFADIRNFTSLSENLEAAGVKRLLNTFFTPVTEIIFKTRGTIDKYVGDMIVAFWGAPIEDEMHAHNAIKSALTIFQNLDRINQLMNKNGLPSVQIGIGLASGFMNVGDMGSEFRRAYTVLGDTVNISSRLQDLTKYYQVNILVNDATRAGQNDILWQTVDKITVKGRKTALVISQPICLLAEAPPEVVRQLDDYHFAIEHYYAREWIEAEQLLLALRKTYPNFYLPQIYLDRLASFKNDPPPADWDGVYMHLQK